MKIYIAARFDRIDEMNEIAARLRDAGHIVDCRWLNGSHQLHPGADEVEAAQGNIPMAAQPFALDDVEDLSAADAILFFSEKPESHSKRGGRHVEFGMAIALRKRLFVIGPRENVFHCLPQVERYDCFENFMAAI